jgi:hypothetical protein
MGFIKTKRPVDARTASNLDMKFDQIRETVIATTSASTALGPRGVFAFTSTSTGEIGLTYTIAPDFQAGDRLSLMVDSVPGTTTPMHILFGDATVAATSATRVAMSTNGTGVRLVAISTSRWLVDGNQGAAFEVTT